jgi:hypothetical protein
MPDWFMEKCAQQPVHIMHRLRIFCKRGSANGRNKRRVHWICSGLIASPEATLPIGTLRNMPFTPLRNMTLDPLPICASSHCQYALRPIEERVIRSIGKWDGW